VLGDGRPDLEGLGDREGLGTDDDVTAGMSGVGLSVGWTVPAGTDTGRTTM